VRPGADAVASLEPAPAFTGLYIGAGVGLNWLQNEHLINAIGTASNQQMWAAPR
jgi:hypothetical protein